MLLLVVFAALLAAPAIVMALMTDLGGNIFPTIQSDKADTADPSANPHRNTSPSPATQGEEADIVDPSANTLPAQTIQSDKDDYAPGKTVTLTGSNWQPGESVHINVNDDQGKTWSRNVDVTADASGRIQYQFQLPTSFVATYEVTAMGEQSGVATTSFTEGNVSFRSTSPAPANWTVDYTTHGAEDTTDNTPCAKGGNDGSRTISPDSTGTTSEGISNEESMRLGTVNVPAGSPLEFDHWTDQDGNAVPKDACLSGDLSGTDGNITDLIAHFESAKQAPEAQPQPIVSTDEDTAKTITLSATDEDGDNLTFFIVSGPNHGTLGPIEAITCTGTAPRTCSANVTYTPDNAYNGFDIFSFKANDGTSDSNPAPVSMLVDPINDTPEATDETKTMSEDGDPLSIDFGALLSDVETSDENLTYDITDPDPAKGSLGGEGSTRNFTPAADFNGTVNIDYTLADRGDPDNCSAANPPCAEAKIGAQKTLTVTVDAVNDAPGFTKGPDQTKDEDAGAQSIPDWATAISAGPNESGQRVDFQLTNDNNGLFAAGGQPSVAPNGTLTYTPADNANGTATVSVKLHDDGDTANVEVDESAEQTFTITVDAVNDAPISHADTTMSNEDTKLVFPSSDLVGNDDEGADNESSQTLTVTEVYDGAHGTVSLGNGGNITFTPEANFSGDATFAYLLCDNGSPSECSVQRANVDVTVSPVNDAPVADNQSVTTDEDTAGEVTLSASDVEGDALSYSIVRAPKHGTLSGTGANLTYTPAEDNIGPDSFTFEASDGTTGSSDPATVSIAVKAVNDAPVANADTRSTDEDTPLVFAATQLLRNDDPGPANESSQTLTVTAVDQAVNGQVSLGTNGDITFTPATGFNEQASFEYTVCDNGSPNECSEMIAIVNVTASQVNDAPGFTSGASQTVAEDSGPHRIPGWATGISAGPADESDQRLTFEVTNNTNTELFSTQPSVAPNGTLRYALAADKNGSADVTVRFEDNGGTANGGADTSAEQTFTINVSAVNDAPMVSNLRGDGAVNEGDVKTYTFDIADVDSTTFSASVGCGGLGKGELVAGSVQITATNGEFECKFLDGLASPTPLDINVQLSDGDKLSNVESKSVKVSNVAPALTDFSSSSQNALAGTLNPVTFTGTATDVSPIDLGAGFRWRWAIDGGAYGPFGAVDANTFEVGGGANDQLFFSTCGTHTVQVQASDKNGAVSAESPQATQSVSVYNGAFSPPLVDGSTNMVQKGQVVPVEISVGCGTMNLTNLTPHIELLSGNVSPEIESGSTTVTTTASVLAADTGQTMRPFDGGYIYNLQVPGDAAVNQEFTIRVNPFGATADHAATGMYAAIKIRE
jgi:VCBS repeat-containing protein